MQMMLMMRETAKSGVRMREAARETVYVYIDDGTTWQLQYIWAEGLVIQLPAKLLPSTARLVGTNTEVPPFIQVPPTI